MNMKIDLIIMLENWYNGNCDGEWENNYGINISNIDNPGWRVVIDLSGTDLDGMEIHTKKVNYDDDMDWYTISIDNNQFKGYGGPRQLGNILEEFGYIVKMEK